MPSLPSSFGGGSGQRCRGDSGASIFSFLGLVDMGSHIRRAHTLAQHTLHTHKNNCGSTGLIPQELKQLKVEVSLWRSTFSLFTAHSSSFSRLAGRQDDQCFSGSPPPRGRWRRWSLDFRHCFVILATGHLGGQRAVCCIIPSFALALERFHFVLYGV